MSTRQYMKLLTVTVLAVLSLLLPVFLTCTPASTLTPGTTPALTPTKPGLPMVPITYRGDTDQTIIRRSEWIEGAKKEGSVFWWSPLGPSDVRPIIAKFNKIHPFIKVNYWRGSSNEITTKLDAEYAGRLYTTDMIMGGGDENIPRWRKMGMLAKFADIIPGIKNMDKRMYGSHGDYSYTGHSILIPQYNTKLVSAAESPKSWEDLLNPKWKGQIGLSTDLATWTILATADNGWGVKRTEDFLRKLREQNPVWGTSLTTVYALVVAGEAKITTSGFLHRYYEYKAKGAPVEWARANPVVCRGAALVVLNKAPHPNATRLFVEWLNSPQGLASIEEVLRGSGLAFPGSGTQTAKILEGEGVGVAAQTKETTMKEVELGLTERFAKILGVTAKEN